MRSLHTEWLAISGKPSNTNKQIIGEITMPTYYTKQQLETKVTYQRKPTQDEIRFGHGTVQYIDVPLKEVLTKQNRIKSWVTGKDGLRYYRA